MFARTAFTLVAALLAAPISARTDLSGCVSSETVKYGGASLLWYVPGTGEICEFLDCGGGRAPPKTTVPGCAAYSGTASYTPSYLPGYGSDSTPSSTAMAIASSTQNPVTTTTLATASSEVTGLPTLTGDTTVITGSLSPTITSAATLSTSTTGSATESIGSTSRTTAASSSSVSAAGGVMATAAPFGILVGLAAGAAAMF
ncbi:hypothetical protein AB5N19_08784 [Seiridium cardinale]|uniref:Siderophore biosynthesis n=1 Tax=Seiridium cardinale TaxID=138064 RepID=A0ABR2XLA1_9PEZI